MKDKIFDFAQTKDALGQLSADLAALESAIRLKQAAAAETKEQTKKQTALHEQQLAILSKAATEALTKIESINKYIEEAL